MKGGGGVLLGTCTPWENWEFIHSDITSDEFSNKCMNRPHY